MSQGEVAQRLEDDRSGGPGRQRVALVDVDPPVRQVGDRLDRDRQVLYPAQREPEVRHQVVERPLGHGARTFVPGRRQGVGGRLLDVGEVVVVGAHLGP